MQQVLEQHKMEWLVNYMKVMKQWYVLYISLYSYIKIVINTGVQRDINDMDKVTDIRRIDYMIVIVKLIQQKYCIKMQRLR